MLQTRMTIFLASGADAAQWQQLHDFHVVSADGDVREAAFLFDYTLGRCLSATDRGNRRPGSFADYFTIAIENGAARAAKNMWAAERVGQTDDSSAISVALLADLLDPLTTHELGQLISQLPDPYPS